MQQLLHPSDYLRMPWKNGGGELLDIYAQPAGAGLGAFDWRASIALVQRSGPFSHFPGVDRTILLLDGVGMRLESAGWSAELATAFEPVRFPGEMSIECTLTDGPTRDFNLMVRRGVVQGDLVVVRDRAVTLPSADAILCFVAAGTVNVVAGDGPARRIDAECTWILETDAADARPIVALSPLTDDTVALVAIITRTAS